MKSILYRSIVRVFNAYLSCAKGGNIEWRNRHEEKIKELCKNNLTHEAGFDKGIKFDFDKSKSNKLVFNTSFHHMDKDVWTDYQIAVTLGHLNFNLKITG